MLMEINTTLPIVRTRRFPVIGDSASPAASLRGSTDIRAGGIAHRKHRSAEGNARKREVPAIEIPKEKF